jgi:predicted O-methyltransferase YrrM
MQLNIEKYEEVIRGYNERNAKYDISRGQSPGDLTVLLTYIDQLPPGAVYVETGTCDGSTVLTLALYRPDIQIYTCDIQDSPKFHKAKEESGIKNITFYNEDSTSLAKRWDKPIDMLFIDTGRHLFPQIFYDFAGWYPWVKPGAPILWHDFEALGPDNTFQIGLAMEIFRGHPKYNLSIPVEDSRFPSCITIITKPNDA